MDISLKREFLTDKFKAGSFLSNIAVLMTGTIGAQIITVAASPIITRLYSPKDFGIFSVYLSVLCLIGSFISWRYDMAIMLPKNIKDAKSLVLLSVIISFFMSITTFIIIFIFRNFFEKIIPGMDFFIYLIPFAALISGLVQIFNAYNNRMKYYGNISLSKISQSSSTAFLQISLKYFNLSGLGLIWGSLIGYCVSFLVLIYKAFSNSALMLKGISIRRILHNFYKYRNFPKYHLFASLLLELGQNVVVFLLTFFYATQIVGYFALANRVLFLPSGLIGQPVKDVFYQRASSIYSETGNIEKLYVKTIKSLFKAYLVPFLIIELFAPVIFAVFFGEKWVMAGIYAQICGLLVLLHMLADIAVYAALILGRQKFILVYHSFFLVFRVLGIAAGYYVFNNHFISIALYSVTGCAFNLFLLIYIYKAVKLKKASGGI